MDRTINNNTTVTTMAEGIRIRKWSSGKTTLRVDFCYRGKRCRETLHLAATAKNIKYAERLRAEVLNAIERGSLDYRKYFPKSKNLHLFCDSESTVTVGELLTDFLVQAKKTVRNSTYLGYKKKTEKYLLPKFGKIPIRELNAAMLRRWISRLSLTTKTVNNILTPLRAVLSMALQDEIIDKDPLQHIVVNKLLDRKTSKSKYKVDRMSQEEVNAILKTAEGQLRHFFQFAFFTGLRTSELLALEWQDIDWIHQEIYITRTFVEGVEEDDTKTLLSRRKVLILPPAWKVILRRAGVRYRNPYQTRHTYASTLLSKGENMMWVAKQMGHVNTEMIIRTYGRWLPDANTLGGYALKNDWNSYLDNTSSPQNCPSRVPLNYDNLGYSEKDQVNQLVALKNLASPRGVEPLLPR